MEDTTTMPAGLKSLSDRDSHSDNNTKALVYWETTDEPVPFSDVDSSREPTVFFDHI